MKKAVVAISAVALASTAAMAYNTASCGACHGANFEKKAMNVSKIVKDMSKDEIIHALKSYRDDANFGGAMKGVMQGQAKKLTDKDIEEIASQIAGK